MFGCVRTVNVTKTGIRSNWKNKTKKNKFFSRWLCGDECQPLSEPCNETDCPQSYHLCDGECIHEDLVCENSTEPACPDHFIACPDGQCRLEDLYYLCPEVSACLPRDVSCNGACHPKEGETKWACYDKYCAGHPSNICIDLDVQCVDGSCSQQFPNVSHFI